MNGKLIGAVLGVAVMVIGCGGDDSSNEGGPSTGGAAGSGGTGGASGAGGSGGSGNSVAFVVVDASTVNSAIWPRLEGATVAFDMPGGTRVERVSGADGKVTFEGVDWSKGNAAVTAHLDGHALFSVVNLDENRLKAAAERLGVDGAPMLLLVRSTSLPVAVRTVQGTVTGLKDPAHSMVVNVAKTQTVTGGLQWFGKGSATFSVKVPEGLPFVLQAFEIGEPQYQATGWDVTLHQMLQKSFDAISDDQTGVVLDFATGAVTTKTADVTWATPKRSDSPVRSGYGVGLVCPEESLACAGWSTHVGLSADASQFEDSFFWTEPAWAKTPATLFRVFDKNADTDSSARLLSWRWVQSWPAAGAMGTLPDTPEWVLPAPGTTTPHPLHQPVKWKLNETDVPYVSFRLENPPINPLYPPTLAWIVEAGADATEATVPEPPSTVVASKLFGTELLGHVAGGWLAPNMVNRLDAGFGSAPIAIQP